MIAVFGATGTTGTHLIKTLLARQVAVRAVVRDADKLRACLDEKTQGLQIAVADLERPASLGPALAGITKVYTAVGGATGMRDLAAAECALFDAAAAAKVQYVIKVSGIDARPDSPSEIQQLHGTASAHLERSGIPFTILEPSFFMQNFLGLAPAIGSGVLPMPTGDAKAGLIDGRDIADVAASLLTNGGGHEGKRYVLTGPELLSHADAARIMSSVLERPIQFVDIPAAAFQGACMQAGLPEWFAARLTNVYETVFATGRAGRVTGDVEAILGRPGRSLGVFMREHHAAFANS